MGIVFLRIEEVLQIHRDQIQRYGGTPGLRDGGLLDSALAMPAASFGGNYLHDGVYEMAAAYLFHVVRNHPFIDGNKRTGTVAAIIFLRMNGVEIQADGEELERLVLAVAEGKADKQAVADFLQKNGKDRPI